VPHADGWADIPKAGGTSVQHVLSRWCAETPRCSYVQWDGSEFRGSSSKCGGLAAEHTILAGHRGFGYCREVETNKRGLISFTVLREPISRIRSLFDYRLAEMNILGKGIEDLSETIVRFNSTPEVEKGEMRLKWLGVQQARFICGYHCMGPEAVVMAKNLTIEQEADRIMQRAMHNLPKINAIGVLERFPELIPQLKYQFDFVPLAFKAWPRENTVKPKKKTVLSDQAMAILRQWARHDIILYERASKLAARKAAEALKCMKLARTAPVSDTKNH